MDLSEEALLQFLCSRRATIAEQWYSTITSTWSWPHSVPVLQQQFKCMTDRMIALLEAESFDPGATQAIGDWLASLHGMPTNVLGQTMMVWGQLFLEGIPEAAAYKIQIRLMLLLSEVAASFARTTSAGRHQQTEQVGHVDLHKLLLTREAAALHTIIAHAPIIVFTLDLAGSITSAEGQGLALLGRSGAELVGQSVFELYPGVSLLRTTIYQLFAGEIVHAVVRIHQHLFETRASPLYDRQGAIVGVMAMAINVTVQQQAEAKLARVHHVLMARQEARLLGLTHELHDGTMQELMGIKYQVEMLRQRVISAPSQDTALPDALENLYQYSLDAVSHLRELISETRPLAVETHDLHIGIESYVATLQSNRHLPYIELDLEAADPPLPQPMIQCLFRLTQEALRNAIQHACAEHITVRLRLRQQIVVLIVRDDGVGFVVPSCLEELAHDHHFGLIGMAERVRFAGGQMRIASCARTGTDLTIYLPVSSWICDGEDHDSCSACR